VVALLANIRSISLLTIARRADAAPVQSYLRAEGPSPRPPRRDHGGYPYQVVLSVAGVWALVRHLMGRTNWVKTAHSGAHLGAAPDHDGGRSAEPVTVGVGA
jgi:hypothetical protein